jgi:hypothetical protein
MEINYRSFEDREKMVVELKSFFLKTLFDCTASIDFNVLNFHDFLNLLSLFS